MKNKHKNSERNSIVNPIEDIFVNHPGLVQKFAFAWIGMMFIIQIISGANADELLVMLSCAMMGITAGMYTILVWMKQE